MEEQMRQIGRGKRYLWSIKVAKSRTVWVWFNLRVGSQRRQRGGERTLISISFHCEA
jgi:hypothetical protein